MATLIVRFAGYRSETAMDLWQDAYHYWDRPSLLLTILPQALFFLFYRREYLDYYASHRMTDDSHVRLYETGRRQHLASLASFYKTSSDPMEAKHLEAAYLRKNRRIARSLAAKKLDKFSLNMLLHAGLVGKSTTREGDEA